MARLFPALPGVGGLLKTAPEDFVVEEIPAYLPSGDGSHTFLFIEKRALTTEEALQRLCRATNVPRDAAGAAGMKDRQAITRQWISLPEVDPEAALALTLPGLRVLAAARHGNKLKTGHLHGNRFSLVLRGIGCEQAEAMARAQAIFTALAATGLPNRFGGQRFGARGDNATRGRELLFGKESDTGRRSTRSERRLMVSALQSQLFNDYLDERLADGLLREPIVGDVLRKRDSGGLFTAGEADLEEVRLRLAEGALDITGPMFGSKMRAPTEDSPAQARELRVLAQAGLEAAPWERLGPIAEGTRRPLTVPVGDPRVEPGESTDSIRLAFSLPSGAYATVLMAELTEHQKA